MNPNDELNAIPMATGIGLKPNDRAVPIAIGANRFVAAVCEVNSDSSRAITQNRPTNNHSFG